MAATFAFTINGVSRISGLQVGSLNIVKTFGRRATLSCQVFSVDGSWHPTMNQEVVWSTDGTPKFGGYIREITYLGKRLRDNNSVFYDISCADYSSLLEDRLVTETFPAGQTLKQWLTTFVTNWLSVKGISLDAGQTNGPTMTQPLQVERMRADVVLQQMLLRSEYVTSGISATKTLLLFASGSVLSPFNVTSTNRTALGDIRVSPLWNGQKYNRVIIKFGVAGVVESFYHDAITVSGTPTSVKLNYPVVGWNPIVAGESFGYGYLDSSVDGRETVAIDPTPFTQGYVYFPTTNTLEKWDGSAFTNGEVLTIPYDFRYPIELIEEDGSAAANPIELLVIDESIRTKEEAQLKAERILAITSTDTERVHYVTAEDDLDIAQTQNVDVPERFFNDDCIITDIRTRDIAVNPGNATAVQFKLRHEVFATAGAQPKRTELDTVMQWSLVGSGSGAVPGATVNSGGGSAVPPFDTYVLFNDEMKMGAASGLRYVKAGGAGGGPETRFVDPADPTDYTRAQVIPGSNGDFELEAAGSSRLMAKEDIDIVADSDATGTVGAIGLTASDGIQLIPGAVGSTYTDLTRLTLLRGFAGQFAVVTSLPFTIHTTSPSDTQEITTFFINSASGTVNLPPLANFRSFPVTDVRRIFVIKNVHASGVVTVDGNSAETIDTATTLTLNPGAGVILHGHTTTNWAVLATTGGVTLAGGGGGASATAPGADKDIILNVAGVFGVDTGVFTYDPAKNQQQVTGIGTYTAFRMIDSNGDDAVLGLWTSSVLPYSDISFGWERINSVDTARSVNPGTVFWDDSDAGRDGVGGEVYVGETPDATLAASDTRGFVIVKEGVFKVYQSGGLGTGAFTGMGLQVDANEDGSGAAAYLSLQARDGTRYYQWNDESAVPRWGSAPPQEDGSPADTSGHVLHHGGRIIKSADESVSNDTLQNDDELLFPVEANTNYILDLVLFVTTGASNTPDIKTAWTLPASATITISQLMYQEATTGVTSLQIGHRYQNTSPSTAQPAGVLTSATQPASSVIQKAVIRVGATAGTAQLQWAQNTSTGGTPTVVKADSYLKYHRVPA